MVHDPIKVPTQVVVNHYVVKTIVVPPHSRMTFLRASFFSQIGIDQYWCLRMGRLPRRL
jgi:hypothetical protein